MTLDIYELIAWAIDFEGCIDIGKRINRNDTSIYSYNIGIYNTSLELLEEFEKRVKFGKILGPYKDRNIKCKDKYIWDLNRKEIKQHLPIIQPFLHLKWRQAELVIEMANILKDRNEWSKLNTQQKRELYTWDEFTTLELCYKECKKLNEKGIRIKY